MEGNLGEVVNTLIQEIKGLQDFTFSLQKTLKEHAENSQYLLLRLIKPKVLQIKTQVIFITNNKRGFA